MSHGVPLSIVSWDNQHYSERIMGTSRRIIVTPLQHNRIYYKGRTISIIGKSLTASKSVDKIMWH